MNRNFDIVDGIYLEQEGHELDLHNNYDFKRMEYAVEKRRLILSWQCSEGNWGRAAKASALNIEFTEVSEFRFMPRDPQVPFTEDDCVSSFGYWVDEDWAEGVILAQPDQQAEPQWLTAIEFMSGAVLVVQAASANAKIMV
ncbi:hypothetical protein [Marinobacter sediminum]|uniref:hypothetical protein n=1 Tax=Marinobacter sediminum TaxID=256323 RepID=UPI00356912C4